MKKWTPDNFPFKVGDVVRLRAPPPSPDFFNTLDQGVSVESLTINGISWQSSHNPEHCPLILFEGNRSYGVFVQHIEWAQGPW